VPEGTPRCHADLSRPRTGCENEPADELGLVCKIVQTLADDRSIIASYARGIVRDNPACWTITFAASERFCFMKTVASSQIEPRTRIEKMLDALRIHADSLHELAVAMKTGDRNEPAVEVEERGPTMSRP
jgi:hypothetical protein